MLLRRNGSLFEYANAFPIFSSLDNSSISPAVCRIKLLHQYSFLDLTLLTASAIQSLASANCPSRAYDLTGCNLDLRIIGLLAGALLKPESFVDVAPCFVEVPKLGVGASSGCETIS